MTTRKNANVSVVIEKLYFSIIKKSNIKSYIIYLPKVYKDLVNRS